MRTPDPAYRLYAENSILHLQDTIRALNTLMLDPNTSAEAVIDAAKRLKTAETLLRTQRARQAKRAEAA